MNPINCSHCECVYPMEFIMECACGKKSDRRYGCPSCFITLVYNPGGGGDGFQEDYLCEKIAEEYKAELIDRFQSDPNAITLMSTREGYLRLDFLTEEELPYFQESS